MAVNLATKYASKLDQLFTAGSYTDRYVNKKYDFTGAKTVEVYTVTTVTPSLTIRASKSLSTMVTTNKAPSLRKLAKLCVLRWKNKLFQ